MIDGKKAANSHKSFTIVAAAMFAMVTGFFMQHPGYIDKVVSLAVSEEWVEMAHDAFIYFISAGGFSAIWFGKVRKAPPLEDR